MQPKIIYLAMKNDINNQKIDKNLIDTEKDIITTQCFDKLSTKGRPKYKLNSLGINIIEKLSHLYCTEEEIAYMLGVDKSVLLNSVNKKPFSLAIKKGEQGGNVRLRKAQFELAKRSPAMSIWMGKQYLGQKDLPDDENSRQNEAEALDKLCNAIKEVAQK